MELKSKLIVFLATLIFCNFSYAIQKEKIVLINGTLLPKTCTCGNNRHAVCSQIVVESVPKCPDIGYLGSQIGYSIENELSKNNKFADVQEFKWSGDMTPHGENLKAKFKKWFIKNVCGEEEKCNVSFLAHSWGSVILTDFLASQKPNSNFKIRTIITYGSPLNAVKSPEHFLQKAIDYYLNHKYDENSKWINIVNKFDLFAYNYTDKEMVVKNLQPDGKLSTKTGPKLFTVINSELDLDFLLEHKQESLEVLKTIGIEYLIILLFDRHLNINTRANLLLKYFNEALKYFNNAHHINSYGPEMIISYITSQIPNYDNTDIHIIKEDEIITGETLNHRFIHNNGTLKDINFEGEQLKGGTLAGKITNKGIVIDVKLSENTEIQGGRLQGNIVGSANGFAQLDNLEILDNTQLTNVNLGKNVIFGTGVSLKDVELMGASISNCKLEGTIRTASSATTIKDVVLGTKTKVIGGKLAGTIKGDSSDRALLQDLTIEANSQLTEVIIADGVDIKTGVNLGTGIQFTTIDNIPFNIDLTQTLPKITNSIAVDLSADPVVDGKGLLVRLNNLPIFADKGWKMDQSDKTGNLKLKVQDITFAFIPVKVKRVDSKDKSLRLGFGNSVYFKTEDGIEVKSHPAVQGLTTLQTLLTAIKLSVTISKEGNIQISINDKRWISGRAELASKLAKYAKTVIGFKLKGYLLVLVFKDNNGHKREQVLYPAPASNVFTEEALLTEEGILSFKLGETAYKGKLDYFVKNGEAIESLTVTEIADSNRDGLKDFLITYPQGYKQKLFALPAAEE